MSITITMKTTAFLDRLQWVDARTDPRSPDGLASPYLPKVAGVRE